MGEECWVICINQHTAVQQTKEERLFLIHRSRYVWGRSEQCGLIRDVDSIIIV
jgi:hypothetical protein